MSKLTTEERVIHILENYVIQGSDVTHNSTWDDLEIDSFDKIEFLMDLEDEFDITIPEETMSLLDNVGDVVQFIDRIS